MCASVTDRAYEEEPECIECEQSIGLSDHLLTARQILPSTSVISPQPSTSRFAISSQEILPYSKVGKRKTTKWGNKKGKTMVTTDTPNKNEIKMQTKLREEKKKIQEERKIKKTLFTKISLE